MRNLLFVILCTLALPGLAADREIPYADMHKVLNRLAGIPDGTYFRARTRFKSEDPAVATGAIKLVIRAKAGDIVVPVPDDGNAAFPLRDDLARENPPVVTNVAPGKLSVTVDLSVSAPPEQRFNYTLLVAMQDEVEGIIAKQGMMARMMAPDFEGLLISFAPGTAASATVEATKPETFKADAEGKVRIPDRRAWRKENPFVQLSAVPLRIELNTD